MKKVILVLNFILLAFMLVFDCLYMFNGELIFKAMASIMFVLIGIGNFIYCIKNKINFKFPIWMLVALICAMLGDIGIYFNFYVGVAIFAMAHIIYFISYCMLRKVKLRDFICGIIIAVILLPIILFTPFINFESSIMQIVCSIYGIIISFMVGKTISNLIQERNFLSITMVIGSVLFLFSDCMLMLKLFADMPKANYLCLGSYYPAQFLLAFSIFIYAFRRLSLSSIHLQ